MPYIKPEDRRKLDRPIATLAIAIKAAVDQPGMDMVDFAGLLNYACTTLALKVIPARRYWAIALISGIFKNIGDEFYRRYAAPYEDDQKDKSGDVYPQY